MTITIHTTARNAPTPGEILAARLRALFASVMEWHEKRRAEAALLELDDHMLRDIGIRRDEIHHYVWG